MASGNIKKERARIIIDEPAAINLFSPEEIAQLAPQLLPAFPKTFKTIGDILKLPLKSFAFGIGDPSQPPPFQAGNADHDNTFHFYWQDSWKIKPSFTLTYGLGWSYESNALNHDLTKPAFLAPIYGANNLGPEHHDFKHFSPIVGFAWSPWKDNKTVFRGGAGIYYDTIDIELRLIERSYLSPFGSGYLELGGSSIPNPIPGIPGVPVNTPLAFQTPTLFTGAILTSLLPAIRAGVAQQVNFNPNNTDLSLRTIDYAKSGTELISNDFTPDSAQHFSLGVQRQIRNDFAISADFVYRHFLHQQIRGDANGNDVDLNHYYRYVNGVQSPVIPICNGQNSAECSTGPIGMIISGGRTVYRGCS